MKADTVISIVICAMEQESARHVMEKDGIMAFTATLYHVQTAILHARENVVNAAARVQYMA